MEALGEKRKTLAESKLGEGRWAQAPRSRLAGLGGMSRLGGGCGGAPAADRSTYRAGGRAEIHGYGCTSMEVTRGRRRATWYVSPSTSVPGIWAGQVLYVRLAGVHRGNAGTRARQTPDPSALSIRSDSNSSTTNAKYCICYDAIVFLLFM